MKLDFWEFNVAARKKGVLMSNQGNFILFHYLFELQNNYKEKTQPLHNNKQNKLTNE